MIRCPVCSSPEVAPTNIHHNVWDYEATIYVCRSCFSRVVHPLPGDALLFRYYRSLWSTQAQVKNSRLLVYILNQLSRAHMNLKSRFRWAFLKSEIKENMRVLEIGAGDGHFCHFLRKKGVEISAIEPSQTSLESLKRFSIKVLGTDLYEIEPDQKFDVILVYHILEHLNDPLRFLQRVYAHLNPDGFIWGEVPNVPFQSGGLSEELLDSVFNNVHLYHFSRKGMQGLLKDIGFFTSECNEIGFGTTNVRKMFPTANFHCLHPSFGKPWREKLAAMLHGLESLLMPNNAVVYKEGEKGFFEPNDYLLFKGLK